jgi:predicted metal-dependent HD superfamily phosphohydrolase
MTLLDRSWRRAWSGLHLSGEGAETFQQLLAAYSEAHRKYHTLQHLSECVVALESVWAAVPHPAEVEMALWFHDSIYDTKRSDNEARSAAWANKTLSSVGASAESLEAVENLILVTKHDALPRTSDEKVLVDIDLSILGASEQRFAEFESQVREEYSFVPGFLFRMKRRAILRTFLEREHIYSTPHFYESLETSARRNLELVLNGRVA